MTDWIKRLEDTWGGMTEGLWYCNSLLNGNWRIDETEEDAPLATMHQGFDEQRLNGQGIVSLANLRHELLALVRAAQEAATSGLRIDEKTVMPILDKASRAKLNEALAALRAKVEGER